MISSEEALEIFRNWVASGSTIKLIAIGPSGHGGSSRFGKLSEVGPDAITFISDGSEILKIPLVAAGFRKLALDEVIHLSRAESWDEGVELHWPSSGNVIAFLRLTLKVSDPPRGVN
jgi:hypothetical protein